VVTITFPTFTQADELIYDPDFTVLLTPGASGSINGGDGGFVSTTGGLVTVIIVPITVFLVVVVGFLVVAAVALFLSLKRKALVRRMTLAGRAGGVTVGVADLNDGNVQEQDEESDD